MRTPLGADLSLPKYKLESSNTLKVKLKSRTTNRQSFLHKIKSTASQRIGETHTHTHTNSQVQEYVFLEKYRNFRITKRNPSRMRKIKSRTRMASKNIRSWKWILRLRSHRPASCTTAARARPRKITCSHAAPARSSATAQAQTQLPQPP